MRTGQSGIVLAVEGVVLLAAAGVIPLGRRLLAEPHRDGIPAPLEGPLRLLLAVGPVAALGGLLLPHGRLGLVLGLPWVVAALLVALQGLCRLAERPRRSLPDLAADLARVYLPVGALWLAAYLGDLTVMGFGGLQSLLTAAHFHYAGFGACAVVALLGRSLDDEGEAGVGRPWRALYTVGGAGLLAGVPLLAAGIAVWRPLEHVAAWDVALATAATGLLLVRRATRPGPPTARGLFVLSGLATLVSATLALEFAAHGFARLGGASLERMVRYHGLVNALGFVGCALVAFAVATPRGRSAPRGVPLSRLYGRLGEAVGPRFFHRTGAVDNGRATGLMDSLDDYGRVGLDTAAVSPAVRHFYEHTRDWELVVVPAWQPGWRLAGRVWKALAGRLGQLNLPWDAAARARPVTSRIVALRGDRDGRPTPRGWVRTYRGTAGDEGEALYVAAYSSHLRDALRYMNIAFPLPGCNMTSVLRLDPYPPRGLALSTRPVDSAPHDGDQGVYLATPLGALRLPLDEVIEVWDAASDPSWPVSLGVPEGVEREAVKALARHDMWCFGLRYLRLTYYLTRRLEAAR